jgi:hypothetical protein
MPASRTIFVNTTLKEVQDLLCNEAKLQIKSSFQSESSPRHQTHPALDYQSPLQECQ